MTVESETTIADTAPLDTATVDTGGTEDAAMAAIWDRAQTEGVTDDGAASAGQERGADGKFVGKAQPGAEQQSSQEGEEGAAALDAGSTAAPGVAAPAHLPQAIKASWDKMPEEARVAIAQHQQEVDRKFSEFGRTLATVKPIADRLSYAQQQFPEFNGMTPEQMAQGAVELAAVQAHLERGSPEDRANTVLQIAQRYGVLEALAARISGGGADQNAQVTALQQEVAHLKQQLSKPQIDERAIEDRISQAMKSRDIQTEVEAFAGKAELWADVENAMPHYVSIAKGMNPDTDFKKVLELAYDMAINADPTVRQKVRALEAAKAATTAQPDTKRVDAAKKAASINVKSTVNGSGRVMTEEEAMASAYDRAMAH